MWRGNANEYKHIKGETSVYFPSQHSPKIIIPNKCLLLYREMEDVMTKEETVFFVTGRIE
jgi:hypothetical protein